MNRDSRILGDWQTKQVLIDGKYLDPFKSLCNRNHSPDGFNWGYSGSGPAQFSLALLLEATTQKNALKHYQQFKADCIATLPQKNIDISAELIYSWLEKKQND